MAIQISDFILIKHLDAAGASPEDIKTHIITHVLHPRVRLATILRQRLELSTMLQNSIIVSDGANITVDKTNAELYLKVISQITALYKSDTQGMMFTSEDTIASS